jgi:hypothetical protein
VWIYDDLDDRENMADFVERCHRDFAATRNPLYAWEAWGVVRFTSRSDFHEPLALPEWLGEYLDGCGRQLLGWLPSLDQGRLIPERKPPVADRGPGAIGERIGFREGLKKSRENWGGSFDEDENLALRVVKLMWSDCLSLDAAAAEAEFRGWKKRGKRVSSRTASRSVEGTQRWALRFMKERLAEETRTWSHDTPVRRSYSDLCRARAPVPRNPSKRRQ